MIVAAENSVGERRSKPKAHVFYVQLPLAMIIVVSVIALGPLVTGFGWLGLNLLPAIGALCVAGSGIGYARGRYGRNAGSDTLQRADAALILGGFLIAIGEIPGAIEMLSSALTQ